MNPSSQVIPVNGKAALPLALRLCSCINANKDRAFSMATRRKIGDLEFGAARSAPLAYRKDLAAAPGKDALDPADGTWIAVATLLCHAAEAPVSARAEIRERAAALARSALQMRTGPRPPRGGRRLARASAAAPVRELVSHMEDAGALNLALTTLQSFAKSMPRLQPLEQGRIVAQAARVAWKAGDLDAAKKRYAAVARMAGRLGEAELRVRAWIGYGVLARLRGNYPDVQKWALRAAKVAEREKLVDLAALAHHSLTVVAGGRGEFEKALVHGWRAYQLSAGDRVAEAEMLLCLGQTLLNGGDPATALSGFAGALVRNPPARIVLPALGGYATASAAIGDETSVRWAAEQVLHRSRVAGVPYESAAALIECVSASVTVGQGPIAGPLRDAARALARAHGYHEIEFRTDTAEPTPALRSRPVPSARAEAIARAVHEEQPDTKPRHIDRMLIKAH
jgi:tetratricopeptide (TPR) repeat protein